MAKPAVKTSSKPVAKAAAPTTAKDKKSEKIEVKAKKKTPEPVEEEDEEAAAEADEAEGEDAEAEPDDEDGEEAEADDDAEGDEPAEADEESAGDEAEADADVDVYTDILDAITSNNDKFKKRAKGESDQDYMTRLVSGVNELDEEVWNSLSEPCQQWYDKCVNLMEKSKPLPYPDGYEPHVGSKDKPKSPAAQQADAAMKKAVKGQTPLAKKKAEKAEKAPKPPKEKKERAPSSVAVIRRAVIDNPEIKNEAIEKLLSSQGMEAKDSTISATATFTRATIADIKKAGHWK